MKKMRPSQLSLLLFGGASFTAASPYPQFRWRGISRRDNSSGYADMIPLSSDSDFSFEILRDLNSAPYGGADIGEVLVAANEIQPGDFESFSGAFDRLANRVHAQAVAIDPVRHPISARDAYFRAASYYRSADFYLHGNWSDPRIYSLWDQQTAAFNSAIALLPIPGERVTLQADGFEVPAIFYGCGQPGPRPTMLMFNGYDGGQEEMYHQLGLGALQRGINVVTFEGPGQPSPRRYQGLGFIPQWERVVTPVVDYALTRPEVDGGKIGLLGASFGGWLAPRAAAFEHRLAAVIAWEGMYSLASTIREQLGPQLMAEYDAGKMAQVNKQLDATAANPSTDTQTRWSIQQGMWAFKAPTPYQWIADTQEYYLTRNLTARIRAPVFVGKAQDDMFFGDQPDQLRDALQGPGQKTTFYEWYGVDGAGAHCSLGAARMVNQVLWDWFTETVKAD
ncbi:alpha/beta-hydrolase [Xylariaceae sp. FL0804]|nr:alpha/beta-hydrolase [Xylariaceae sp. FL0804]